tara:strand:+ start:3127 stop:4944 length:1818 start_codon:yes stop_codon:yes gene_type:complete
MADDRANNSRKQLRVINYAGRDFSSIRQNLLDYVRRYYPDSYQDFNTAGFGSLVLDTVSYVGDVLSFYVDYQLNESFLDTAQEYDNVVRIARQLGYKYADSFSSVGKAEFFVSIPADSAGSPNESYIPTLKANSSFTATGGQLFTLVEDVNFATPSNQIVVNKINSATGAPTHFAIKAVGTVISGRVELQQVTLGDFQKFRKIRLSDPNPLEVLRVSDEEGHRYYEVDHLAQEIVFKAIRNNNADKNLVPSILKAIPVTRRFVLERNRNEAFLQFGYGSEDQLTNASVADPSNITLKLHGRDYITQQDFDPTNLTETDKFGVGPSNTTLTILYRVNDASDVNIASKTLTQVAGASFNFANRQSLSSATLEAVEGSLEVSNENPILGDISIPTADELKQRVFSHFAAQNRAVTLEDYKAISYAMPPSFGAIKRCSFERDFDAFKRNLNMYVISTDSNGYLGTTNQTVKENLKTWLTNYKMINDTIDILDARVVNFGVNFSIVADYEENRFNVLNLAVQRLRNFYSNEEFDIFEPIYVVDIYKELQRVPGVVDVLDVKILQKTGSPYSEIAYDLEGALSNDGRFINGVKDVIFELKYPTTDIQGSVT